MCAPFLSVIKLITLYNKILFSLHTFCFRSCTLSVKNSAFIVFETFEQHKTKVKRKKFVGANLRKIVNSFPTPWFTSERRVGRNKCSVAMGTSEQFVAFRQKETNRQALLNLTPLCTVERENIVTKCVYKETSASYYYSTNITYCYYFSFIETSTVRKNRFRV